MQEVIRNVYRKRVSFERSRDALQSFTLARLPGSNESTLVQSHRRLYSFPFSQNAEFAEKKLETCKIVLDRTKYKFF